MDVPENHWMSKILTLDEQNMHVGWATNTHPNIIHNDIKQSNICWEKIINWSSFW